MPSTAIMKYADVDMQDVQKQVSAQVQIHSNANGTLDRGIRRNRTSDSTVSSSAKAAPEVIDLDEEDLPPRENEAAPLTISGVTTTVKKVSLPWQRSQNLGIADKGPVESSVEGVAAGGPLERESVIVTEKKVPVGADEAVSNKAEGERKRPSAVAAEERDVKKPKIDGGAKVASDTAKSSEVKESPIQSPRDSSDVSVVDLVDEDEADLDQVVIPKEVDRNAGCEDSKKGDALVKTGEKAVVTVKRKIDSPVSNVETGLASSVIQMVTSVSSVSVQSSGSVTSGMSVDEKRTALSSLVNTGKNGLITQMQSIEVKKVKLCPQLEKQATAMTAVTSMTVTPVVATPKPATGPALAQIPVSITATTPERTEIPTLASSESPESAKEVVKEVEPVLFGSDLEKKKGLNPIHSETRKMMSKLTRTELESFFLELACELILSKSELGKYRQMYEEIKDICESKSAKIASLTRQVSDFSAIINRVDNEVKEKRFALPVKITRSVGIQLEATHIINAGKAKVKEDKPFATPPATSNTNSISPASALDRTQSPRLGRLPMVSSLKTTPPSTPNGLIMGAGAKDSPPVVPAQGKSPQRQLRALHPRVSPSTAHPPSTVTPQPPPEATPKRLGFIDIAEEKIVGSQIGVRRHRASAVMVATTSGNSINTTSALSALTASQVMAPTLKVVPPQYTHTAAVPGSNYSQPGGNTRVVTATTIPVASGAPITSPRLTYLIPTSTAMPVQQRQLVLASAAPQSQQIRGRSPSTSLSTMLMRPNAAIVQVPSGSIATTTPALIRAVQPTSTQQMLATAKNQPQQQASRVLGMPSRPSPPSSRVIPVQHPAPLPAQPQPTVVNANLKPIPRQPVLKLSKVSNGIVLSWNMTMTTPHEEIASYQLYAYQEGANAPPSPSLWKKVGDVKALPLPMACTLTQFADGHTYHFAVRAVDVHGRVGEFSVPGTIELFS